MLSDATGLENISSDVAQDGQPAWSPDGTKLAFVSTRGGNGTTADIYVMNADGTGVKRLTNTPQVNETEPSWSPDGEEIASQCQRAEPGRLVTDVCVMPSRRRHDPQPDGGRPGRRPAARLEPGQQGARLLELAQEHEQPLRDLRRPGRRREGAQAHLDGRRREPARRSRRTGASSRSSATAPAAPTRGACS